MRIFRIALSVLLGVGLVSIAGCKVIEDSDSTRETTAANEERVDVHTLPLNVTAAVKGVMPTGVITDGQQETRRGKMVYNLNVKDGEKKYNVLVSPDGTILASKQLAK
jgi:hypothetical protein